jgi:hypothetical protein
MMNLPADDGDESDKQAGGQEACDELLDLQR